MGSSRAEQEMRGGGGVDRRVGYRSVGEAPARRLSGSAAAVARSGGSSRAAGARGSSRTSTSELDSGRRKPKLRPPALPSQSARVQHLPELPPTMRASKTPTRAAPPGRHFPCLVFGGSLVIAAAASATSERGCAWIWPLGEELRSRHFRVWEGSGEKMGRWGKGGEGRSRGARDLGEVGEKGPVGRGEDIGRCPNLGGRQAASEVDSAGSGSGEVATGVGASEDGAGSGSREAAAAGRRGGHCARGGGRNEGNMWGGMDPME